jgi:hypothetical protein
LDIQDAFEESRIVTYERVLQIPPPDEMLVYKYPLEVNPFNNFKILISRTDSDNRMAGGVWKDVTCPSFVPIFNLIWLGGRAPRPWQEMFIHLRKCEDFILKNGVIPTFSPFPFYIQNVTGGESQEKATAAAAAEPGKEKERKEALEEKIWNDVEIMLREKAKTILN